MPSPHGGGSFFVAVGDAVMYLKFLETLNKGKEDIHVVSLHSH